MSHQSELIGTDIDAYLAQHEKKELLRLLTCGSVDDGKSTLIGRLLHDSKMIYEDQLAAVAADSVKSGTTGEDIDLALLVDGLQAEREQGITIDVAYRYFSTSKRKFIIADTPGHEQYTRNMATGASTCDLAVILVDARHGVQTQTRRHSIISALLGIRHIIVAVNKMDLVGYDEKPYDDIKSDYLNFVSKLDQTDLQFIPVSALKGDNVVNHSEQMPWYTGEPLMTILNNTDVVADRNFEAMRFPVQYVNRPDPDFRGYCGTIASGVVRKGDKVTALPSGKASTVASIVTYEGERDDAFTPMAVTLLLKDEIDISRGDMITHRHNLPLSGRHFEANIVWMAEESMAINKQYYIKLASKTVTGSISEIEYRIDVNTLSRSGADKLHLNEIGHCTIVVSVPVSVDAYKQYKGTGSFIIIDRLSHATVGAGMITGLAAATEIHPVTNKERTSRYGQDPFTVWLYGENNLSVAEKIERHLFDSGRVCTILKQSNISGDIEEISDLFRQAGLIAIVVVNTAIEKDGAQNSAFDCRYQSVDEILKQIRGKMQAR